MPTDPPSQPRANCACRGCTTYALSGDSGEWQALVMAALVHFRPSGLRGALLLSNVPTTATALLLLTNPRQSLSLPLLTPRSSSQSRKPRKRTGFLLRLHRSALLVAGLGLRPHLLRETDCIHYRLTRVMHAQLCQQRDSYHFL